MDLLMVAWKLDVCHPRGTYWHSAPDWISPFSPPGWVKGYGSEEEEFVDSRFSSSWEEAFLSLTGYVWM